MELVYDTSIFVELERKGEDADPQIFDISKGKHICITAPTVSELWLGVADKDEERRKKLDARIDKHRILNTTKESAKTFSELKLQLAGKGSMIPDFDILIASIVIDRGAKLLTRDAHFEKIESLDAEII